MAALDIECWCGAEATWVLPVDTAVTNPNRTMGDGMPGIAVCDKHVDKDGYETIHMTTPGYGDNEGAFEDEDPDDANDWYNENALYEEEM
jgi:hypothetical protein